MNIDYIKYWTLEKNKLIICRLYRNEEFVMDYNGPRTENDFIRFVTAVNQKDSIEITKASDIEKLINNSTDKFFISFASKVIKFRCVKY